jgi:inorganic pyrophosphatase
VVNAYIEMTPFDLVKYEVDKVTGYLRIDRPSRASSQPPALYGFIPRTYCDRRVQELSPGSRRGDRDPLDICVISERPIDRAEVLIHARVVGGIQMIDNEEADDKIVAVLENDLVWDTANDISDLPAVIVERLQHYFETYKRIPGRQPNIRIERTYGRDHAEDVVRAAMSDYDEGFGG